AGPSGAGSRRALRVAGWPATGVPVASRFRATSEASSTVTLASLAARESSGAPALARGEHCTGAQIVIPTALTLPSIVRKFSSRAKVPASPWVRTPSAFSPAVFALRRSVISGKRRSILEPFSVYLIPPSRLREEFGPLPMVALLELVTRRNSPVELGLPAASTWRNFMPFRLDFDSSISAPRNSTPAGSAMSSFRRLALSICALNGSEGSSTSTGSMEKPARNSSPIRTLFGASILTVTLSVLNSCGPARLVEGTAWQLRDMDAEVVSAREAWGMNNIPPPSSASVAVVEMTFFIPLLLKLVNVSRPPAGAERLGGG